MLVWTRRDFSDFLKRLKWFLLSLTPIFFSLHAQSQQSESSDLVWTVQASGGFAQGIINPILEFIRMPDIASGISLMILISGVFCVMLVLYTKYNDLNMLTQMGRLFPNSEREFANRYPQFEQKMAKFPVMFRAWTEFCETLVLPDSRSKNLVFKNTVRPHIFFNLDRLELGVDDMKAWPGIFLGIGLLFTSLGIISVLGDVSGMARETVEPSDATAGIFQNFAGSLSIALYSFVSGLFVYIALTISLKSSEMAINRRLNQLNDKIERGVHFVTQESLAQDSLVLMENQLEQLRNINEFKVRDGGGALGTKK